ncbi:NAD-dependent deacetylase [Marinilactibacillus piezotolerans]|uniref:protein acetyllysine N-acetyltransferase n=1 Tax=Marinilactibacillus piezotolerans TaxID=258723 RepID=A0A1I3Y555_9LACT|nr:NAD-dependent protein deacylase [Marinilactibacillus piezotolerans]SFK26850.1 NAD-dependent deacetylase [Marinilactibacillus piezotolerans]
MDSKILQLKDYIDEAEIVVFFGGAGVSTESGLPDYRSRNGQYTEMEEQNLDPKVIMSRKYLIENPEAFFNRPKKSVAIPEPNDAHKTLAKMEQAGKDIRVITQNVDGLHQKAGHRFVLELHGHNRTWYCMECSRVYEPEEVERDERHIPRCPIEQGIVRPSVVLFGENPDKGVLEKSRETIHKADLLIIAGTSLTVNPAKNLIHRFKGKRVVVINNEEIDTGKLKVDLYIEGKVGETFKAINE